MIDFGFAVMSGSALGTFCGTPTYMAPELIKKSDYYGHNVDKWALGVLLYRMVTGLYPFRAQKDRELYKKITSGVYDKKLLPSEELRDLISKLLKVNAGERVGLDMLLRHKWFVSMEKFYNEIE